MFRRGSILAGVIFLLCSIQIFAETPTDLFWLDCGNNVVDEASVFFTGVDSLQLSLREISLVVGDGPGMAAARNDNIVKNDPKPNYSKAIKEMARDYARNMVQGMQILHDPLGTALNWAEGKLK
jgi:hypothetical protein